MAAPFTPSACLAALWLAALTATTAAAEPPADLAEPLVSCRALRSSVARLDCYDSIAEGLPPVPGEVTEREEPVRLDVKTFDYTKPRAATVSPAPAGPASASDAPAQATPTASDLPKADTTKADEIKVDTTKTDEIKVDAAKVDTVKADTVKADEIKADSAKPGEAKADPTPAPTVKSEAVAPAVDNAAPPPPGTAKPDSAAKPPPAAKPAPKAAGQWEIVVENSGRTAIAVLAADEPVNGKTPRLWLRCTGGNTAVFVELHTPVSAQRPLKLVYNEDEHEKWWIEASADGRFLGTFASKDATLIIKRLARATSLEVTAGKDERHALTAEFTLNGIKEAVKPIAKACNW